MQRAYAWGILSELLQIIIKHFILALWNVVSLNICVNCTEAVPVSVFKLRWFKLENSILGTWDKVWKASELLVWNSHFETEQNVKITLGWMLLIQNRTSVRTAGFFQNFSYLIPPLDLKVNLRILSCKTAQKCVLMRAYKGKTSTAMSVPHKN